MKIVHTKYYNTNDDDDDGSGGGSGSDGDSYGDGDFNEKKNHVAQQFA